MGANDQTKLLKMQYFLKNFKEQLRGLIRISIREDTLADFRDKTASIIIHYPLEEKEENIVTSRILIWNGLILSKKKSTGPP